MLYAIVDNPSPELVINKAIDALVLKPLLTPISTILTPLLEKSRVIQDPRSHK